VPILAEKFKLILDKEKYLPGPQWTEKERSLWGDE
jgi:hypothetical protein